MRAPSRFERIGRAFGKRWRKYIVDECPDARVERIRQERIEDIKIYADLRESMRLWEIQNQQQTQDAEHTS